MCIFERPEKQSFTILAMIAVNLDFALGPEEFKH